MLDLRIRLKHDILPENKIYFARLRLFVYSFVRLNVQKNNGKVIDADSAAPTFCMH